MMTRFKVALSDMHQFEFMINTLPPPPPLRHSFIYLL